MAAKTLAVNVTVDGETYPAGSTLPAEVAAQVTNPKAWGDSPDVDGSDEKPAKRTTRRKTE